jgi:hypothetical protein
MAVCTNQRVDAATGSVSTVKEDAGGGLVEEDSKPSLVTSTGALTGSDPDEEVVKEATPESGQIAASARTNQRGASTAAGAIRGSVEEEDGGNRDEEADSKPSVVTSSSALLAGNCPDKKVVCDEATTPDEIPSGWKRTKLEPDC